MLETGGWGELESTPAVGLYYISEKLEAEPESTLKIQRKKT